MSPTIAFDFGGEWICNCMDILWVDIAKLIFAIVTIVFRHVLFWKPMQGRDLHGVSSVYNETKWDQVWIEILKT